MEEIFRADGVMQGDRQRDAYVCGAKSEGMAGKAKRLCKKKVAKYGVVTFPLSASPV